MTASIRPTATLWPTCAGVIVLALIWAPSSFADEKVLPGGDAYPWYDPATDQLKRMDVEPPDLIPDRTSRWKREIAPSSAAGGSSTTGGGNWWNQTGITSIQDVLIWLLLGIGALVLIYFLTRTVLKEARFRSTGGQRTRKRIEGEGEAILVESLPFRLSPTRRNLLEEARYWYEQGDYSQAITYLYGHLLVELDRGQCIRLARGKTNRQYLRELRERIPLFEILKAAMLVFEDAFFGEQVIARDRFELCWNQLAEFQQLVERAQA